MMILKNSGWLATMASLAVAASLIASPAVAAGKMKDQASSVSMANDRNETINVIAADALIDQTIYDNDFKSIGKLKYLVIRPDTGRILYGLIGDHGVENAANEFFAVPWDVFQTSMWPGRYYSGLTLSAKREKVLGARHWDVKRLAELSKPRVVTETYEYFGVDTPADSETRDTADDITIGKGFVARLGQPIVVAENQLRGVPVESELGGDLGVIDKIVLDIDHGRVAYVLTSRGGFLGSGDEWLAIPVQAFQWNGYDVTVDLDAEAFKDLKPLDKMVGIPTWVRKKDLNELYEVFGVDTYLSS